MEAEEEKNTVETLETSKIFANLQNILIETATDLIHMTYAVSNFVMR